MMNQEDFLAELSRGAEAVTGVLDSILAEKNGHENRVVEAMRYASLAGGKRVRPFWFVQRQPCLTSKNRAHFALQRPWN